MSLGVFVCLRNSSENCEMTCQLIPVFIMVKCVRHREAILKGCFLGLQFLEDSFPGPLGDTNYHELSCTKKQTSIVRVTLTNISCPYLLA